MREITPQVESMYRTIVEEERLENERTIEYVKKVLTNWGVVFSNDGDAFLKFKNRLDLDDKLLFFVRQEQYREFKAGKFYYEHMRLIDDLTHNKFDSLPYDIQMFLGHIGFRFEY